MRIVGLIPARGGSKRLPNKNIALLDGKPLIAHTCAAARKSGALAEVFVNTDCRTIANVAAEHGVACPLLRPAALAADDTPTRNANIFLLNHLAERGQRFDAVMVLQPTSPLRTAEDIRAAVCVFKSNAPCRVVSVSPVAPASWVGRVDEAGRFERLPGEDTVHRLNGAIYIHAWDDYLEGWIAAKTVAYRMPVERGVDVDTVDDLHYAEFLIRERCMTQALQS